MELEDGKQDLKQVLQNFVEASLATEGEAMKAFQAMQCRSKTRCNAHWVAVMEDCIQFSRQQMDWYMRLEEFYNTPSTNDQN